MSPNTNEAPHWVTRLTTNPWFIAAWLAFITLALYIPVVGFDLVAFDDFDYITTNPQVSRGLTAEGFRWAFVTGHSSNWHPLTWLSLMLDVTLWHGHVGWMHMTNVFLHVADVLLLFALVRRLTGAHWRSALVAGLFALHPLHVESVAWVAERKDVLSLFFGLLSLWFYVERQRAKGKGQMYYLGALLCFALGLMSKPMLVTLPCVMLLLDYWPLRRMKKDEGGMMNWKRLVLEKTPFFVLAAVSCVVTVVVQRHGGAVQSAEDYPLWSRVSNALVSYVLYLVKAAWPVKLSILYPHPGQWPIWVALGSLLLLALLTGLAWRSRKDRPYAWMGWLWYLGTLVPVIGLIQVGAQGMADRYFYLPSVGIFLIVTWTAGDWLVRWRTPAWVGQAAGYVVLTAMAMRAGDQLPYWHDTETVFRRALAVTTKNYVAHNDLGYYLHTHGHRDEAMTEYGRALAIKPDYADALNNLGYAEYQAGKPAEAAKHFEAALRANPGHVEARNNFAMVLDGLDKLEEAAAEYRRVLALDPGHANAHGNLGITLAKQGKLDEAMAQFRAALSLQPDDATTRNNFGAALALQGKYAEAVVEYEQALRRMPDYAEAHNNLGFALNKLGRREEAIKHLREALRLKPDYAEAKHQLSELGVPLNP